MSEESNLKEILQDTSLSFHDRSVKAAEFLGFEKVNVLSMDPLKGVRSIETRPKGWIRHYNRRGYMLQDPITVFGIQNPNILSPDSRPEDMQGITYEEAVLRSELHQARIFGEARDWSINAGYGISFRLGKSGGGMVNFYSQYEKEFMQTLKRRRETVHKVAAAMFEGFHEQGQTPEPQKPSLTTREKEVLNIIAIGKTSAEAGLILGIKAKTVDAHIESARIKLKAINRVATCVKAVQLGLIEPYDYRLPEN